MISGWRCVPGSDDDQAPHTKGISRIRGENTFARWEEKHCCLDRQGLREAGSSDFVFMSCPSWSFTKGPVEKKLCIWILTQVYIYKCSVCVCGGGVGRGYDFPFNFSSLYIVSELFYLNLFRGNYPDKHWNVLGVPSTCENTVFLLHNITVLQA